MIYWEDLHKAVKKNAKKDQVGSLPMEMDYVESIQTVDEEFKA